MSHSPDIDECTRGTDNCDVNADCVNTDGSFLCVCRAGYEGTGQTCTGKNYVVHCRVHILNPNSM